MSSGNQSTNSSLMVGVLIQGKLNYAVAKEGSLLGDNWEVGKYGKKNFPKNLLKLEITNINKLELIEGAYYEFEMKGEKAMLVKQVNSNPNPGEHLTGYLY